MKITALLTIFVVVATAAFAGESSVIHQPQPSVLMDGWSPGARPALMQAIEAQISEREWDNWKINSDLTSELQNEEQVGINPLNSDNLVAVWRDFRLGYREVGVGYSFDGGLTWTDYLIDGPEPYPWHSDPGLTWDRFGNFYAVILSFVDTNSPNGLFVLKSSDGGVSWGEPATVVNGVPGVFEDKELIACDRSGGPHDGNLYVAWARFYSTQIYVGRSINGGDSFQSPQQISDQGGVQWPVPVVGPGGVVYVAWAQYFPDAIRLDRSFDGGVTYGSDITVTDTYSASTTLNGGITAYSFPAMDCDITGGLYHGRLYVAYMDRNAGDRDIFLRYSDNQGLSWSPRLRINDDPVGNGADQFLPWLVVSDDGVVSVVFYDRRNDPANYDMDLYFAQSLDGGASFTANERVTTVSSDPQAGSYRAGLIGEYIGLAAVSADRVHPVWTDTREGNQDVYTTIITSGTGVATGPDPIAALRVQAPSPNPFRGSTRLGFQSPRAEAVTGAVYDLRGRRVAELAAAGEGGGAGSVRWDGRDARGRVLASGVYLIRLSDGVSASTARVLLMD